MEPPPAFGVADQNEGLNVDAGGEGGEGAGADDLIPMAPPVDDIVIEDEEEPPAVGDTVPPPPVEVEAKFEPIVVAGGAKAESPYSSAKGEVKDPTKTDTEEPKTENQVVESEKGNPDPDMDIQL
jgi:hypothetical protein